MATPIETNTSGLQEILQTVYNLPMAGGGSSEPDLVIGLNIANTKMWTDNSTEGGNKFARNLSDMNTNDVSIVSGSVAATADKVKQGLPVKVLLQTIHFYWSDSWYQTMGEANDVVVYNTTTYPTENTSILCAVFFLGNMAYGSALPCYVRFNFDIATGATRSYLYDNLVVE